MTDNNGSTEVRLHVDGREIAQVMTDARGRLEIVHEPRTYEQNQAPEKRASYFRDLALSESGDNESRERLARHAKEMRVNPNTTDGTGGYFAPPLWLNEAFATAPRPKRVFADLLPKFPLPAGVSEINLPRLSTGTLMTVQVPDTAVPERDMVDAEVHSPVAMFAGQEDVALQLLEQSPQGAHLDWAIFKDLMESIDYQLGIQLINGSGKNGQFTGLLNVEGISKVEYTSGSPTAEAMFLEFGKCAAKLGDARLLPPEVWLARTARWSWLGSGEDKEGLPLSVPGHQPPFSAIPGLFDDNRPTPTVPILGWPVYLEDAIPATFGAGKNQDVVIACRPTDSILLESQPRTSVLVDVLSGTLTARLQAHVSAAFLPRYPSGISIIEGTGLVVQSGY